MGLVGTLGLTFLVQAVVTLLAAAVPVLAPLIATEQGWSMALLGAYPSLVYAGTLLGSLATAFLLQRHGAFGVSLGCVALGGLGVCGLLPGILGAAALAALAVGLANGPLTAASSQLLGGVAGGRRVGLVLAAKQTSVPAGAMLAGLMVPLLALGFGWKGAVVVLGAMSLAVVLLCRPAIPRIDRARAAPAGRGLLRPLRDLAAVPGMRGVLLASMAFAVLQLLLRTFLVAYLVEELGLGLALAGALFAAAQGAGVLGQLGWAALADGRTGARGTLALVGATIAVAAVWLAALPADGSVAAAACASIVFGAAAAGYRPVVLAEIVRRAPAGAAGTLTAGQTTCSTASIMVGLPVFGAVAAAGGYRVAFVLAALLAASGVLALAVSRSAGSRPHRAGTAQRAEG